MINNKRSQDPGHDDTNSALDLSLDELIGMAHVDKRRQFNSQIKSHQPGDWRDRYRGRGLELESIGPYQAGDDVRHIDWHATARTGQPQIKRFYSEIQWTLIIVVDLRPSMFFGSEHHLMAKTAALTAARMAFSMASGHQSVGFVVLEPDREHILWPRRGKIARLRRLNDLVDAYRRARSTAFDAVIPLDHYLLRLNEKLPKNAEVALISDFSYTGSKFDEALNALGQRSLRVVIIDDALHLQRPPRGRYPVKLAGNAPMTMVNLGRNSERGSANYEEENERQRQDLLRQFANVGIRNINSLSADTLLKSVIR